MIILNLKNGKGTIRACQLPFGLEFHKFYNFRDALNKTQFLASEDHDGLRLDVPSRHYRFDLDAWLATNHSCNNSDFFPGVEVKFPKKFTLQKHFNISGLAKFVLLFNKQIKIHLANINSIEIDLGILLAYNNTDYSSARKDMEIEVISLNLYNSRLDFRLSNGKPIESCQQLIDANKTSPKSIFQMALKGHLHLVLLNPQYIRPLCPLLFRHSKISELAITSLIDTF